MMVEIIRGTKVQKTGYSEKVKSERRLFIELPLEDEIKDEIKTTITQSIKSLFNFFLKYFHNRTLPIIYPQVNNKVPIIIKTIPNGFAFEKSVKKNAENIDENTNIVITV